MTKSTSPQDVGGHVSIKPEGMGPRDSLFTFQAQKKRFGGAVGISIATHMAIAFLLIVVARYVAPETFEAVLPDQLSNRLPAVPGAGWRRGRRQQDAGPAQAGRDPESQAA
jgi:hypothetical protein